MYIVIRFEQLLNFRAYNERSCTFLFTIIFNTSKKYITYIGDGGAWVHRQTLEALSCLSLYSRYLCNEMFTYFIQRIIIYISFYRFLIARHIELAYSDVTYQTCLSSRLLVDLVTSFEIESTPMVNIGNQLLPLGTICRHWWPNLPLVTIWWTLNAPTVSNHTNVTLFHTYMVLMNTNSTFNTLTLM